MCEANLIDAGWCVPPMLLEDRGHAARSISRYRVAGHSRHRAQTICGLKYLQMNPIMLLKTIKAMHAHMGCKSQKFRPLMLVKETLIYFDPAIPELMAADEGPKSILGSLKIIIITQQSPTRPETVGSPCIWRRGRGPDAAAVRATALRQLAWASGMASNLLISLSEGVLLLFLCAVDP